MDLPGAQRLAGLDQFAAGRQHHDPGAGADLDRAAADGGEQADLGGAEDRARPQGRLAFGGIAAAGADMGAGGGRAVDADLAGGVLGAALWARIVAAGPSPVPPSVHSTGTTASAPGGSGAPVMMRAAWPGPISGSAPLPAATSPRTVRVTGASCVAAATSAARTA